MAITGAYHTGGGIAAVNRLIIKTLSKVNSFITIYSLLEENSQIDYRYSGFSAISLHTYKGNKVLFSLSVIKDLLLNKYDYIYVDHVNLAFFLFPLVALKKLKYITWLHGIEVFEPRPDSEGLIGLKFAWKRLCSSQYTCDNVKGRFPDIKFIPCDLALDPVLYSQGTFQDSQFNIQDLKFIAINGVEQIIGPNLILNVGRMVSGERYKGQDSLINAFPQTLAKHPDAQLLLAGTGDDYFFFKSIVLQMRPEVQEKIFMPGFVDDALLKKLYGACYIFAMPSIGEGFGLTYLEAMAHEKPCLGGKIDATPYVIRDGITGILVNDPRSAEQVSIALNWFMDHPRETRQMGKTGGELVRTYYLYQHFEQRFWKALEG